MDILMITLLVFSTILNFVFYGMYCNERLAKEKRKAPKIQSRANQNKRKESSSRNQTCEERG